jgi:hypothetical protein
LIENQHIKQKFDVGHPFSPSSILYQKMTPEAVTVLDFYYGRSRVGNATVSFE